MIDSGTSYLLVPTDDFKGIAEFFDGMLECADNYMYGGLYTCSCTNDEYMATPDLKI